MAAIIELIAADHLMTPHMAADGMPAARPVTTCTAARLDACVSCGFQ